MKTEIKAGQRVYFVIAGGKEQIDYKLYEGSVYFVSKVPLIDGRNIGVIVGEKIGNRIVSKRIRLKPQHVISAKRGLAAKVKLLERVAAVAVEEAGELQREVNKALGRSEQWQRAVRNACIDVRMAADSAKWQRAVDKRSQAIRRHQLMNTPPTKKGKKR